jgi:CRP-like cAMP-binding protein
MFTARIRFSEAPAAERGMSSRLDGVQREEPMPPPYSMNGHPFGNRLLDAIAPDVAERLRPHLESVALEANQAIHTPGSMVEHAYFPTRGLISLVATMHDGASVEVGMIGNEGMFSVSAILGDDRPSQRAMVQLAGTALRLPVRLLRQETRANAAFQTMLLRYAQVTLTSAAQTAACNRLHLLEQRCARWLLSAHDRAEGDTFRMTHEFLAMMLGVRRPGVTVAVQALQASGMMTYNHGTMTILDRKSLEAAACECYRFIQDEYARLLGPRAEHRDAPASAGARSRELE